jgi:hypothetical protein
MYIVVNHRISDPEFWAAAQRELPRLPDGISIHGVFPNADGSLATCLWKAESVSVLREYLEHHTGNFAKNEYMAVDDTKAMGLPG